MCQNSDITRQHLLVSHLPMRKIRNPAVRIQADKSVLVITVSHTAPATMVSRPPRDRKTGPYVLFPLPHSVRIARIKSMPATISNNMQNKSKEQSVKCVLQSNSLFSSTKQE